jgi:hypothetical protein
MFTLLRHGARAIVCLHHSPKASGKAAFMTLENVLRGTGDFGAMCEVVWGIERARRKKGRSWDNDYAKESESLTRLSVECLKGRDIPDVADPFVIQGRPHLDEIGDFVVTRRGNINLEPPGRSVKEREETLTRMILADPLVSIRSLSKVTGWNNASVKQHALRQGWQWVEDKGWVKGASPGQSPAPPTVSALFPDSPAPESSPMSEDYLN